MTGAGEAEYIFHAAQRPALEAWLVSQRLVAHHYADDLATGAPCFVVVPAAELRITRDVLRGDDPPDVAAVRRWAQDQAIASVAKRPRRDDDPPDPADVCADRP